MGKRKAESVEPSAMDDVVGSVIELAGAELLETKTASMLNDFAHLANRMRTLRNHSIAPFPSDPMMAPVFCSFEVMQKSLFLMGASFAAVLGQTELLSLPAMHSQPRTVKFRGWWPCVAEIPKQPLYWTFEEHSCLQEQYARTGATILTQLVDAVRSRNAADIQLRLDCLQKEANLRRQLAAFIKHSSLTVTDVSMAINPSLLHVIAPWLRAVFVGDVSDVCDVIQRFLAEKGFIAVFEDDKAPLFESMLNGQRLPAFKVVQFDPVVAATRAESAAPTTAGTVVNKSPIVKLTHAPDACTRCLQTGHFARDCKVTGGGEIAKVWLHGLPTVALNERELRAWINAVANVATLQVFRDNATRNYTGSAIATLWSADDADKVYRALNRQTFVGQQVFVNLHRSHPQYESSSGKRARVAAPRGRPVSTAAPFRGGFGAQPLKPFGL
eukprot:TRINITY_DN9796_c0_g1_i1.p1 TRINITY_DN9796_c0_g1~~TRINITY_DN9796_c0_g1_i1.p1  ORF type:complete len:442 (+),score=79.19 TRINITY_DN9796_c0_g1_i1:64-1389(+)